MSVCGYINSTLFYSCHCLFAHNPTISEVSHVFSKCLQRLRKNLLHPECRPCAVHVQVWRRWEASLLNTSRCGIFNLSFSRRKSVSIPSEISSGYPHGYWFSLAAHSLINHCL